MRWCVVVAEHLEGVPTQNVVKAYLHAALQAEEERQSKPKKGGRKKAMKENDDSDDGSYQPTVVRPGVGRGSTLQQPYLCSECARCGTVADMCVVLYVVLHGIRMTARNKSVMGALEERASGRQTQPIKPSRYSALPLLASISNGRPGEQSVSRFSIPETAEMRFERERRAENENRAQREHGRRFFLPDPTKLLAVKEREEHRTATDTDDTADADFEPRPSYSRDNHPNPTIRTSNLSSSFRSASRLISPSSLSSSSQSKLSALWPSSYSSSSSSSSSFDPKPVRTSDESGMRNLGNSCFSECDTRVLTGSGFLFLADIEARIDAGQRVLYACYDTSTQSIVYKPGRLVLVAPPTRWVDFTHASTQRLWDATSNDYGSTLPESGAYANNLTLRTTPDHNMYVQLCTGCEEDGHESYQPRLADGTPVPPHKQPAQELAPGYQCDCIAAGRTCTHGYSHYRMYTGAASGLQPPADVISLTDRGPSSPVVSLGLHTTDELHAFLELFGYWLGNGWMSYDARSEPTSKNGVCFAPNDDRDREYLRSLLARLHLVCGQHFISCENGLRFELHITEPRLFRFFDDEFGVAYSHSPHYDRRLALLKQGVHNTWRRPSTASSVSASSTVSAAVTSSTRARSLSASVSVELVADYRSDDDDEGMSSCEFDLLEDEDDPAASVMWLPDWSLFRLDAEHLRLVIEGLRQADGSSKATAAQRQSAAAGGKAMQGEQQIYTSSVGFRDQLIHACVHAGYSAHFTLNTAAGEVCGYNAVPKDDCIYSQEKMEAALQVDSTRHFKPVRGKHDSWWVCYSEAISELLPAQDVRFDGSAYRVRQQKELRSGQAIQKQQQAAAISTQPGDTYDQKRDGRVWCVNVQHDDHLIFVQRAHCNASGIVTKVGRTMIVGNCYMNAILQALLAQPTFTTALLQTQPPAPLPASSLLSALSSLAELHGQVNRDVIDPRLVKEVIGRRQSRFAGYRQQDAHEFLMELLNGVTDDLIEAQLVQWRKKQPKSEERKEGHEQDEEEEQHGGEKHDRDRGMAMELEIDLEHDNDRTRTPPSLLSLSTFTSPAGLLSPTSFMMDTPRSDTASPVGGDTLEALVAAAHNGEQNRFGASALSPSNPLSPAVHSIGSHSTIDGMQQQQRQEDEEVKLAPATPPSASSPIVLRPTSGLDDDAHAVIDVSETFNEDDDWPIITSPTATALSPPTSPSTNTTSPIPPLSTAPPPPSHLLKLWQQQASELSPAHLTFHLEVEVTLECANAECQYRRTNMEHFNVLSLDLPEEEVKQKKLDEWMVNGAGSGEKKNEGSRASDSRTSDGSINDNSFVNFPSSTSSASSSATTASMLTSPTSSAAAATDKNANIAAYLKLNATNSSPAPSQLSSHFTSDAKSYSRHLPTPTTSPFASSSATSTLDFPSSSPSSASSSRSVVPAAARPYGPRLTVRSLVQSFFAPSTIECRCEKCQHTHVRVTSRIARLPRVLCLHIKRFTPNWRLGTYEKRKDVVEVQQKLDIAFACKSDVQRPHTQPKQQQPDNNIVCPTPMKHNANTPQPDKPAPLTPSSIPAPASPSSTVPVTPRASAMSSATSSPSPSAPVSSSSHAVSFSDGLSPVSAKRGRDESASGPYEFNDASASSKRSRPSVPSSPFTSGSRSACEERLVACKTEWTHKQAELSKKIQQASAKGDEELYLQLAMQLSQMEADYEEKLRLLEVEVRKESLARERKMKEEEEERKRRQEEKSRKQSLDEHNNEEEEEEDEEAVLVRVLAESQREADDKKKREEDEWQRALQLSRTEAGGRLDDDDDDSQHAEHDQQHDQQLPTFIATPPPLSKLQPGPPSTPSSTASSVSGAAAPSARYVLKGVVLHKGVSSSSGHYVADLLDDSSGQAVWKRYDDQYVDKLTDRDRMLKTWQSEAYILFFTLT